MLLVLLVNYDDDDKGEDEEEVVQLWPTSFGTKSPRTEDTRGLFTKVKTINMLDQKWQLLVRTWKD